jgi:hypothetical protein
MTYHGEIPSWPVGQTVQVDTYLRLTDYHERSFLRGREILIWRFEIVGSANDSSSLLRLLLRHNAYAHSCIGSYPPSPKPDMRGPFVLSRLSASSFTPVSKDGMWAQLDEFFREGELPTARADSQIDVLAGSAIEAADEIWQLLASDSDRYETGWIVGGFLDFVVVQRNARSMLVLATCVD